MSEMNGAAPAAGGEGANGSVNTGGAGAPSQGTGGGNSPWYGSFNDELKGYVEQKGFQGPEAVTDAYRNLEKLMGVPKERLLKLPTAEEADKWGEVYDKLGRPSDPEHYSFDSLGEGVDENFAAQMRSAFHEAGLNTNQTEKILNTYKGYVDQVNQGLETQKQEMLVKQEQNLKKEWGAAYEKNINYAKRAAKAFGLNDEKIGKLQDALGLDGTLMFLQEIGSKTMEDDFVGADSQGNAFGVMSPNVAKNKIETLKKDRSFQERLMKGDSQAKAEWNSLHEYAYNF